MREELYDICRETLENEEASKKFRGMQTVDDLYEYLKEKVPDLSEEEFEDFMVDAMGYYQESCENTENSTGPIGDDALENVAGGVSLGQKVASAGLALMAFFPAAGATNFNKDAGRVGASADASLSQKVDSGKSIASSRFQKVKNWVKNHKRLVIGTAVAAGAVVAGGVVYKVHKDNQRRAEENKKVGEPKNEIQEIKKKTAADYSSLKRAVSDGNIEAVKEFLNNPGQATAADKQEAMFEAIGSGRVEELKLLIDNGVNINGYDQNGYTALCKAVKEAGLYNKERKSSKEIVDLLLSKGADVNAKSKHGKSGLEEASDYADVYEIFLKHGYGSQQVLDKIRKSDIEHQLVYGTMDKFKELLKTDTKTYKASLLLKAAENDKPEAMKLLIEDYGSNINLDSDLGVKILANAIYFGREEIVNLLLKNKVKIDFNSTGEGFGFSVGAGLSHAHFKVFSDLISNHCKNENIRRAVLKAAVGIEGLSVGEDPLLIWAFKNDKLRSDINDLLDQGVKMNLNVKGTDGCTVLDLAAKEGNIKLVNKLLNKGAKINWVDNFTLEKAARYGGKNKDLVDLILSKHNDPSKLKFIGFMPGAIKCENNILVWAYEHGYNEILEKYMNEQLVDERGRNGESLIAKAIGKQDTNMVKRLIKDYSSKVCTDGYWRWAIDTANPEIYRMFSQYNNKKELSKGLNRIFQDKQDNDVDKILQTAKDLLNKGADINARDAYDRVPLMWAVQGDSPELVDFLVEHGADVTVVGDDNANKGTSILEEAAISRGSLASRYLKNLVKSKTCTVDVLQKAVGMCDDAMSKFAKLQKIPTNDVKEMFRRLNETVRGKHLVESYKILSEVLHEKLGS